MIEKIMDVLFMETDVIMCEDYETAASAAAMLVEVFGNPTTYQKHCRWRQIGGSFIFEVQIPIKYQKRYNKIFKDHSDIKEIGAA